MKKLFNALLMTTKKMCDNKNKKVNVAAITLFYAVALAFRYFALYLLPVVWPAANSILYQYATGMGPALGALVAAAAFHKKTFCSLWGTSLLRSMLCVALPILLLWCFDGSQWKTSSVVFLGCISYALLEEIGWRGFLLGELAHKNKWNRILWVSLLWFFWHINIPQGWGALAFGIILFFASWGLDQLAGDTHSLILCACMHGIFNLFKHGNGLFNNTATIYIFILSIVLWFAIWYVPVKKLSREAGAGHKPSSF